MISIIIPVLNEEESIGPLMGELMKVLHIMGKPYEILFIDDGSTDTSLEVLKKLIKSNNKIRVFSFRRNLGKSEALTFGFAKAKGDFIITLDADLQDKPSEIPRLLEKANEGVEVVCGWRQNQKRPQQMIFISKLFNSMLRYLFDVKIHDYNCGLKVYTKDAAKSLRLYGGLHRFIPLLAYQQGFTVDEVPVQHEERKFGISKYGFSKLWTDLPDIFSMVFLAKYSKRPLHFFGVVGGLMAFIGILILLYLSIIHFMGATIGTRPLLVFGVLFVIAGFQVLFTGFLADLLINISHNPRFTDEENMHFPVKFSTDRK